jgi:hypothetical protein
MTEKQNIIMNNVKIKRWQYEKTFRNSRKKYCECLCTILKI